MKPSPLLNTQFIAPPLRDHLPRPQLVQWLEGQAQRRLVLISAPPGYGKTTLRVDFLAGHSGPAIWYQLEASDSDPTVFLTYLIGKWSVVGQRWVHVSEAARWRGEDSSSLHSSPVPSAMVQAE